jgi:ribosomal protein L4
VKITLYMTPELRKALLMQALREDESATGLVERLVTQYLAEKRQQRQTVKTRKRQRGG